MKNTILFLVLISLASCQKETIDKAEFSTRLKSIQTVGGETIHFVYDEKNQLTGLNAGDLYQSFIYDIDGHISKSLSSYENYSDKYENSYNYDEQGRLISKESIYIDQNGEEKEPSIRLLSYEDGGFIGTKNPGDYYNDFYKMSNGNVEYLNCFNCAPVPEFSYTNIPSPLPEELANTWRFYGPTLSFMTHLEIYSKNIPKGFYSFVGLGMPVAVENEILLNEQGFPIEIKVILKEDYNENLKNGHVLNSTILEYETIEKPF